MYYIGCRRRRLWLNLRYCPRNFLGGAQDTYENSVCLTTSGRDLNLGPSRCEARAQISTQLVVMTRLCYEIFLCKTKYRQVDPLLDNGREISNYTIAVARQWLSSDHVGISTGANAAIELQQRNCIFYLVRAEML
jgi:hypothetical protein